MIKSQENIQMVDLQSQYKRLQSEIDAAMKKVIDSSIFIKGPFLKEFEENLAAYLNVKHVIGVANGTDALQIAFMALNLEEGDEVIVPAFTYVATVEVIGLLGLVPVMVDVCPDTFNVKADEIESAITLKTKAIVPVHLFGQSSNMESIMDLARRYNLYVVEDNAQAIGGDYRFKNGEMVKTGTIGDIGCTSFFPSKNLGCFGDGGAMFTNNNELAANIRMIANHGQKKKYHHSVLGVNSRLDALQAAVLDVKLKHLDDFADRRREVASSYDLAFTDSDFIQTPVRADYSTHVFHQYTMKIEQGKRDALKDYLASRNIPSMIYYPLPLYKQEAFKRYHKEGSFEVTEQLCRSVLSLPIHTEMHKETQDYIINTIKEFDT